MHHITAYVWHISHCHCHVCVDWIVLPFVLQIDAICANDGKFRPEGSIKATAERVQRFQHQLYLERAGARKLMYGTHVAHTKISTFSSVPSGWIKPSSVISLNISVYTVTFGSSSASRYPIPGVGRRHPTLNVVGMIALQSLSSCFSRCRISLLAY